MRALEFAREFSQKKYGEMVDYLNSVLQNGITLIDNMSGQIIDFSITAGTELRLNHRLKSVPKYRIILRQDANVVIYDGNDWNDKYITLNASSDVNGKILLMRG
jgi:hypothetical protein